MLENYIFNTKDNYNYTPYALPILVVNKIYPEFADDIANVICLCDASLMHFHPGEVFIKTIYKIKNIMWMPEDYTDH